MGSTALVIGLAAVAVLVIRRRNTTNKPTQPEKHSQESSPTSNDKNFADIDEYEMVDSGPSGPSVYESVAPIDVDVEHIYAKVSN